MSPAMRDLEALASRVRLLESDVEAVERGEGGGADRPYLLPATEEQSVTRIDNTMRAGASIDTVSDRPTPEEIAARGIRLETWCRSLTGTAQLCGITPYSADASPYDPGDPQAWAGKYRKFRDRVLAGSLDRRAGTCASCPAGDSAPDGALYEYDSTYSVTCDAEEPASVTRTLSGLPGPCTAGAPFAYAVTELDLFFFTVTASCPADLSGGEGPVSQVYTLLTRTVSGCGCHTAGGTSYTETLGTATETLEEEVTFFEVLEELLAAGGDVTEGESCCTEISAMEYREPKSIAPHNVTGTAGARYVHVVGGDPGVDYAVIITLERLVYNEVTEEYDTETQEVLLAVRGSTITRYDVPITAPGEPGWCATSATLGS